MRLLGETITKSLSWTRTARALAPAATTEPEARSAPLVAARLRAPSTTLTSPVTSLTFHTGLSAARAVVPIARSAGTSASIALFIVSLPHKGLLRACLLRGRCLQGHEEAGLTQR